MYDVTIWLQIITIDILPSILGTKGSQTISQIKELNKKIIFLQKSC